MGGLGKGLDALFNTTMIEEIQNDSKIAKEQKQGEEKVERIKINRIEPNRNQPRKDFDEDKLQELADSIKEHGVIQPIIVVKRNDYYEIVAGERRWRASKKVGLKTIPAIVRDLDEKKNREAALIENIQRQDLNVIEEAKAIKEIMEEYSLTQEQMAERLGKKRSSLANIVRLLNLDERVQQLIIEGELTEGHGKVLVAHPKDKQYDMALNIIKNGGTVRVLEEKILRKKSKIKPDKQREVIIKDIENNLKELLGTKVKLESKKDKGKIIIEYFSEEELERIIEYLNK